jgi:hypothetical protein
MRTAKEVESGMDRSNEDMSDLLEKLEFAKAMAQKQAPSLLMSSDPTVVSRAHEAIMTANFLRNRSPVSGKSKTPWELFWGRKPDLSHLRVFGCTAFVHVPRTQRSKLEPTATRGVMLGYEQPGRNYRIWAGGKVIISATVLFDEQRRGWDSGQWDAAGCSSEEDDSGSDDDPTRLPPGWTVW